MKRLLTFALLCCSGIVLAQVAEGGSPCALTTSDCTGGEVMDDGTAEVWVSWSETVTSGVRVQRLTPPYYPYDLAEVCIAWRGNGTDTEISYDVVVYDDDGFDSKPGTLLASVPAVTTGVPASGFIFGSTSVSVPAVTEGSIYIGMRYDASVELGFWHPQDESPSTPEQVGYTSSNGGTTWFAADLGHPDFRAFFIRVRSRRPYVVVPRAQWYSDGNDLSDDPFNLPLSRYQQIFQGTEVGSGWITEIRFRLDRGELGKAFGPILLQNVTVTLSTTATAVDPLSSTFSDNVGSDVVTVFQGDLTLSSGGVVSNPREFDIIIPLQRDFWFQGTATDNLLLDIKKPNGYIGLTYFDASFAIDSVSRAFCGEVQACPTGDLAAVVDTIGLATLFMFREPVFSDGFESGDTSTWSATVP